MANKKISELISAENITKPDLFVIVQEVENKKLTFDKLINSLSTFFSSNNEYSELKDEINQIKSNINNIYSELLEAIQIGDNNVIESLTNSLNQQFTTLKDLINQIEDTHDIDFQFLRSTMQEWINEIDQKLDSADLSFLESKIESLQNQINLLHEQILNIGTKGDYEVTIYAVSNVQPQRPKFQNKPTQTGSLGPDNVRWFYDIPAGDTIWYSRGIFDGSTNIAKEVDGEYWAYPTRLSGKNTYFGELSSTGFTVASDSNGIVTAEEIASVKATYNLKYGTTTLINGTDYSIQIIQPDVQNTSKMINRTDINQIWLTELDNNIDTTAFNIQFIIDGAIITTSRITISKAKEGPPGNFNANIYSYKSSKPTRPDFTTLPTETGLRGPDNTLWYLTIPSGNPIWMCKATFSGITGEPIIIDGYRWTDPLKITGQDGSSGSSGNWTSFVFKQSTTQPDTPTGTNPIPTGWSDAPTSNGIWWMSKSTINGNTGQAGSWSNPIKVTGEDGTGSNYIDFKYRKNNSSTVSPGIIIDQRHPASWSDVPPTLNSGEYLWMTQAEIDNNDNLVGTWSNPVRISGEAGNDGQPGTPGNFYSMWYTIASGQPVTPTRDTIPITNSFVDGGVTWNNTVQYSASGDTWMTQAEVQGGTYRIVGTWSTPIMVSGKIGQTSPTWVGRGEWSSTNTYYKTTDRIDVVYYTPTSKWYYRSGNEASVTGNAQNPTYTAYWTPYQGNFESVATGLFYTDQASIAGWQFYKNYIASQNRNVWLDGRTYNVNDGSGAYPISIGPGAADNPPAGLFWVDYTGKFNATSGDIGPWTFTNSQFKSHLTTTVVDQNPVLHIGGSGPLNLDFNGTYLGMCKNYQGAGATVLNANVQNMIKASGTISGTADHKTALLIESMYAPAGKHNTALVTYGNVNITGGFSAYEAAYWNTYPNYSNGFHFSKAIYNLTTNTTITLPSQTNVQEWFGRVQDQVTNYLNVMAVYSFTILNIGSGVVTINGLNSSSIGGTSISLTRGRAATLGIFNADWYLLSTNYNALII